MPKKKYNHVHKYERTKMGDKKWTVYRCIHPSCTHYVLPEMLVHREAKCHHCDTVFIIDKECSKLARPSCDECRQKRAEIHHPPRPGERKYGIDKTVLSSLLKDIESKFLDEINKDSFKTEQKDSQSEHSSRVSSLALELERILKQE